MHGEYDFFKKRGNLSPMKSSRRSDRQGTRGGPTAADDSRTRPPRVVVPKLPHEQPVFEPQAWAEAMQW